MSLYHKLTSTLVLFSVLCAVQSAERDPLGAARQFIANYENTVRPLEIAQQTAEWNADVTGTEAAFKAKEEAQNRLDAALSDPTRIGALKQIRDGLKNSKQAVDSVVGREIEVLYLTYLGKQLDPALLKQIAAKESKIGKTFNAYRARVDGKELTDSEVREILKTSRDSQQRKAVWEASKAVGALVEPDLKELVGLRNQAAQKLGFKNYHVMALYLNEQEQRDILRLFDELDTLTRKPFRAAKKRIDENLAKLSGVQPADLRPWHYQDPFFQEPPANDTAPIAAVYAHADILKLCRDYYAGIGLPVDAVLARSDLYEKPGKYPHARCADIDREGDVRVIANIVPNEYWAGTMLHELGHSVYASINIPKQVPYILRGPAHSLTTEGVAMMFEQASLDTAWMTGMGLTVSDIKAAEASAAEARRNHLLIFAAWAQVMFRFEMALYDRPGQDLNKLWWGLVERYQGVRRPENRNAPDYAAKIHIAQYPAYYHNYLMGQLFASQLHHTIAREVLKTAPSRALYIGRKEVGEFMKKKVFAPAATRPWNEFIEFATGEKLNPKAFAEDFKPRKVD